VYILYVNNTHSWQYISDASFGSVHVLFFLPLTQYASKGRKKQHHTIYHFFKFSGFFHSKQQKADRINIISNTFSLSFLAWFIYCLFSLLHSKQQKAERSSIIPFTFSLSFLAWFICHSFSLLQSMHQKAEETLYHLPFLLFIPLQ
jgi:hypothetical protein